MNHYDVRVGTSREVKLMKLYLNRVVTKESWSYAKILNDESSKIHSFEFCMDRFEFNSLIRYLKENHVPFLAWENGKEASYDG